MDKNYLVFANQVTTKENVFTKKDNADGTITLTPDLGEVINGGTPQNATNFNAVNGQALGARVLAVINANFEKWNKQAAENEETFLCGQLTNAPAGTPVSITIPKDKTRNHTGYNVVVDITTATAPVSAVITDKQLNGFKVTPVGGAMSGQVLVRGGVY